MKKILSTLIISLLIISYSSAQETETNEPKKWEFGLHFDNLSDVQKSFNAGTNGVVINKVSKDHPSEAAGVQVGDILTHIDNISIKDLEHCLQAMKDYDTSKGLATLKIIRNGVKMDITVKLE